MTHEQIRDEISLYALGSLDPDDRRSVEEHLAAGCPECERELGVWGQVVGALAANDVRRPGPGLRDRLLARVGGKVGGARVIAFPRWATVPVAAAAGIALVAGVIRERQLGGVIGRQATRVAVLERELDEARQAFESVRADLRAREADVSALRSSLASAEMALDLLQRPGLRLVRLDATEAQPGGAAHALMSAEAGRAIVYAFDLPAVPAEKTYELWWITEKAGPVNAGLFRPDAKGIGRIEASLPADYGVIKAAAVTIEPAAGVAKPTGPMVLLGNVT